MSKDLNEFNEFSGKFPNSDDDEVGKSLDEFEEDLEDKSSPANLRNLGEEGVEDEEGDDYADTDKGPLEIKIGGIRTERDANITGYIDKQFNLFVARKAETFTWVKTPNNKIDKVSKTYAGPEFFSDPPSIVEKRIVLVYGEPHTGRYTTCVYLANKYKSKGLVKEILSLRCTAKSNILALLLDTSCPSDCVFILRNGFDDRGISEQEIREASAEITHLLNEHNSYLFITHDKNLNLPSDVLQHQSSQLSFIQRKQVLNSYLDEKIYDLMPGLGPLLKKETDQIANSLRSGYEIDQLLSNISDWKLFPENPELVVQQEIASVANFTNGLDKWFDGLKDNLVMYFAITVGLFPDLDANSILKRLDTDTSFLRNKGDKIPSIRDGAHGLNYFLQAANCQISDWGTVEFKSRLYSSQILEQFRSNYNFHYWPLSEIYLQEIEKHYKGRDVLLRISYAKALAEILASDDQDVLEAMLTRLGESKYRSVRASTGHALKHILNIGADQQVEDLMKKWSHSASGKLRWSSLAAGERLFSALPSVVTDIMSYLANDVRMQGVLCHAILGVSKIKLSKIVELLINWMRKYSNTQSAGRDIALIASFELLGEIEPNDDIRMKTVLPLVVEILLTTGARLSMFSIIKNWFVSGLSPKIREMLNDVLANQLTKGDTESASDFQAIIFTDWLKDENFQVNEVARLLLDFRGATSMQNTVTGNKAAMILDISDKDTSNTIKAFSRTISQRLSSKFNWKYYYLGISKEIRNDDPQTELYELQQQKPLRLIGPILEDLDGDNVDIVLVLASGTPLDLADWSNTHWKNKLVLDYLVGTGKPISPFLCLSTTSETEVEEVLNKIAAASND